MDQNTKHTVPVSDDIDLLVLIERLILFFRRYRWVFVIATVLGLAAGLLVYMKQPRVYQSRMVLHSFLLTNQEQIQIIENWNDLLSKKELDELSAALNCPEDSLQFVKKITADEILKVFSPNNPNGFVVEVTVTDNAVLPTLQKAIVYGLENNQYVKQRLDSRRSNLQELINKTTIEIARLDSTKKEIENIIEGKGKSSSSLIVDGAAINRQLIDMNEKLLTYKDDLKFTASVQVFQGFSKFVRPTGPHLLPWLFIGLVVFFTLGFIYAFASALEMKLKRRTAMHSGAK